jgi:hypothetical protein
MQAQDLIKSWAKEGGRKFSWIAAQVPVTPNTMSAWMNGHAIPNAVCRNRLADIVDNINIREASAWGKL